MIEENDEDLGPMLNGVKIRTCDGAEDVMIWL